MIKLRRTDGALEYTLSLAYTVFQTSDGVIDVPDEVAVWAAGTGLFEPAPEPEAKPRRTRSYDAPPAVEEEG